MGILKQSEIELKASWMQIRDSINEIRLTDSKTDGLLTNFLNLPHNLDPQRICIIWPSEYGWSLVHKWVFPLLSEFKRNFAVKFKPLPKYCNVIYFEVEINGKTYPFAIDTYDKVEINKKCASKAKTYFKMQYATEGYSFNNIVPGGFVPANSSIYLHLNKVRKIRNSQSFIYEVYGRFGSRFAKTIRRQATEKLAAQNKFSYEGGIGRVSYKKSLYEIAASKVCVDLPGHGPLCFRLIDYLAVGSCIVAYPHKAKLPVPLTPGKEIVYCQEDLSDLNDICEYYINHDREREEIARASRAYFDTHLRRPVLASYYINTIINSVRAKTAA